VAALSEAMQVGMIGLGRMGAKMVRRLMRGGHRCMVYDMSQDAVQALAKEGAVGSVSLDDFAKKIEKPCVMHNGIEDGIMAASAEGLNILRHANVGRRARAADAETTPAGDVEHYRYDLNLADIVHLRHPRDPYLLNVLMAGMIPVTVSLMARDPSATEPTGPRFWGAMSLAILVGALAAYPVNVWLVARGLKHGMGAVEVLGRGGHSLDVERGLMRRKADGAPAPSGRESPARYRGGGRGMLRTEVVLVTLASLGALAVGVVISVRFGGL